MGPEVLLLFIDKFQLAESLAFFAHHVWCATGLSPFANLFVSNNGMLRFALLA